MRMHRYRVVWIALLALVLATGPGIAQVAAQSAGTPTAGAASNGSVAKYRAQTRLKPSAFGPAKGSLTHDPNTIALAPAGVDLYNFYATVRVTAPYDGADQLWDAGFVFRAGRDADWRFVVYSDGTWDARLGSGDPVANGDIPNFKAGVGDTDTLELAVDGDTAYVAVNQDELGSFDVSRRSVSGDVEFGVTFTDAAVKVGADTAYARFQVWELKDNGTTAKVDPALVSLLEQGRDVADSGDPVGGPLSDSLNETAKSVSIKSLGVSESDFYLRAEVTTPRDGSTTPFDVGFGFRDTGGDNQYRLVFASDGTWYLTYGLNPASAANRFDGMKSGAGQKNLFEIVASGNQLVFAVNGNAVGNGDIGDTTDAGDIAIGVGFYPDTDIVEGDTTAFSGFSAWSLTGAAPPATGTKSPTAAPTSEANPTGAPPKKTPTTRATRTPVPTEVVSTPEPTATQEVVTREPTQEEVATVPAAADAAGIFTAYLLSEPALTSLYGPESGTLDLSADSIAYQNANLDVTDFVAHVAFINPYAASSGDWDVGFLFRVGQNEPHLRLVIGSTGDWYLTPSAGDPIQQGTVDNLKTGNKQTNTVDLVVVGDTGYFGVNGEFVSDLDLSSVTQSGDIAIGTSFFQGSFKAGASTGYKDFQIWEPGTSVINGSPTAEATVEATRPPKGKTPTAISGTTYTSETYGYTVTYDDNWEISDQSSDKGTDYVRFSDGVSTIDFTGYESDFTPQECLDDEFNYYQTADGYSDAQLAQDTDNNDLTGALDDGVFGVYTFTYTPQGGDPTDYVAYVECHPLETGVSLLKIVQFVTSDSYNDEIDARVALLKGLTLAGAAAASPTETANETVTPEGTAAGETVTPEPTEQALAASIEAIDNSGDSGVASITFSGRKATVIVLGLGADDGIVPVIQKGACDALPGEAAFELNPLRNGVSQTTITASYDELLTGGYVITFSDSLDSLDQPLGCGAIIG
jgi:hypothetical protein